MMTFAETRRRIRDDCERFNAFGRGGLPLSRFRFISILSRPGVLAVALYRLAHWLHHRKWYRCASLLHLANLALTGADIAPESDIGGGCVIVHPCGIIVCGVLGQHATLFPRVIVAPETLRDGLAGAPVIGDNATLAVMTSVLGPVRLADNISVMPFSLIDFSVDEADLIVRRLPNEDAFRMKKRAPEGSSFAARTPAGGAAAQ